MLEVFQWPELQNFLLEESILNGINELDKLKTLTDREEITLRIILGCEKKAFDKKLWRLQLTL